MQAAKYDRRIRILRHGRGPTNEFGEPAEIWAESERLWAAKMDVSDGERVKAAGVGAVLTARFHVRRNAVTKTITEQDRVLYLAKIYDITGLKEADDNDAIELSVALTREQPA